MAKRVKAWFIRAKSGSSRIPAPADSLQKAARAGTGTRPGTLRLPTARRTITARQH